MTSWKEIEKEIDNLQKQIIKIKVLVVQKKAENEGQAIVWSDEE